jgi:hypothetical protein
MYTSLCNTRWVQNNNLRRTPSCSLPCLGRTACDRLVALVFYRVDKIENGFSDTSFLIQELMVLHGMLNTVTYIRVVTA